MCASCVWFFANVGADAAAASAFVDFICSRSFTSPALSVVPPTTFLPMLMKLPSSSFAAFSASVIFGKPVSACSLLCDMLRFQLLQQFTPVEITVIINSDCLAKFLPLNIVPKNQQRIKMRRVQTL